MSVELEKLLRRVSLKIAGLPAIAAIDDPEVSRASMDAHHAGARALVDELVTHHGARFSTPSGGFRLSMGGVITTCTSGESGLLTNWVNAAQRKLDEGRAE